MNIAPTQPTLPDPTYIFPFDDDVLDWDDPFDDDNDETEYDIYDPYWDEIESGDEVF